MMIKKLTLATAAMALAISPTVTHAAQANVDRVSAPVKAESDLEGGNSIILYVLAAVAVIVGIIIIADDNEEPVSA